MYDTGAAQAVRLVWFGCIMYDGYSGVGTAKNRPIVLVKVYYMQVHLEVNVFHTKNLIVHLRNQLLNIYKL